MKVWIRTPLFFAALAAVVSFGACSDDDGGATEPPPEEPAPMEVTVNMVDNSFDEQEATIRVGGTVTWVNVGSSDHNTTSEDGIWESGTMSTDDTFEETFDTAGTFDYECTFHSGMIGTIRVE